MTVPLTERFFTPIPVALPWGAFGQAVSQAGAGGSAGFTLICALTEPLPIDSRIDYVLMCHEDADEFRWTFSDAGSGLKLKTHSEDTVAWVTVDGAGTLRTEVVVLLAGVVRATVTLTQSVAAPPAAFLTLEAKVASEGAGANLLFSLREVCLELRDYILTAASATGANGIPSRLLAGVLFRETMPRPKDGSPKALAYRKELEGAVITDPVLQAGLDKVQRAFGRKVRARHLDDIREEEIATVRAIFNDALSITGAALFNSIGPKSLGVGQVAQTTAAMVSGAMTWRELTTTTRSTVLAAIESDYQALSYDDRLGIFNLLRFPKTNVVAVANVLLKLKNRTHRFPAMTARALVGDATAIGILATEYNHGGYDTPNAGVTISDYADDVKKLVLATEDWFGLTQYFPDPPP